MTSSLRKQTRMCGLYERLLVVGVCSFGTLLHDAAGRIEAESPVTQSAPPIFVSPSLGMGDYDITVRELLDQGDFHGALAWVQDALDADPEEYRARFMRAVLNAQRFGVQDVRRDLERVAEIEPMTPIVLVARLQLVALYDDTHEDEALAGLHALAHWDGGGYWVLRLLGSYLVRQEKYAMARPYTEYMVQLVSEPDPWLLWLHSRVLADNQRLDEAVELLQQAVSKLPLGTFYRTLAWYLYQAGDTEAADAAMKESIDRFPVHHGPDITFIDSLRGEPDGTAARQRYEAVTEAHLTFARAQVRMAQDLRYHGHTQEALDILYAVIESAPRHDRAEALRRIGRIYDDGGAGVPVQRDKAVDYMRQAAELGDAQAAGFIAFVLDYPRSGDRDPEGAYKFYQKAFYGGCKQAMSNLGIMYRSGRGVPKDTGKSLVLYLKAMHGGHLPSYNNAAWLLFNESSLWDERAAVDWAEHAAREQPCNPHFNTLIRVHLRCDNVNAADEAWHRWHRWWRSTHVEDREPPRNFQNLRKQIDAAREQATGGAS